MSNQVTHNRFYVFISTLFFAVVLAGFSRSFYLRTYFEFPELGVHLYMHGIALTGWFTLAFVQPWLVRFRRTDLHRRLGTVGVVLAISVVISGIWTVALRDAPDIDELPTRAAGNLASLLMFSTCVVLGIFFRHKPAVHKRLMLLASVPILAPALDRLARIPSLNEFCSRTLYWFPAPPEVAFATLCFLILLLSVVVNDLVSEHKVQSGTWWGLFAILIVSPVTTYVVIASGVWVIFVHWLA